MYDIVGKVQYIPGEGEHRGIEGIEGKTPTKSENHH